MEEDESGLLKAWPCGEKAPALMGRTAPKSHFVPPSSLILFPPQQALSFVEKDHELALQSFAESPLRLQQLTQQILGSLGLQDAN
jgi:hypothetical protein